MRVAAAMPDMFKNMQAQNAGSLGISSTYDINAYTISNASYTPSTSYTASTIK